MNNYTTSPQLLSPRPTLPASSQFPQSSWSDWPSEAPIDEYRAYSDPIEQQHTTFIPHLRHTADSYYSSENQQGPVSTQREFAETAPNLSSTLRHLGDRDGYIQQPCQQPFLVSGPSFERGNQSTYATNHQPRYYAAHRPIAPEQRSSYSELAANLSFMNSQARPPIRKGTTPTPDHYIPNGISDNVKPRTTTPSLDPKQNPFALGLNGPPLTAIGRKVPPPPPPPVSSGHKVENTTTPSPTTKTTGKSRSVSEPRRPSLACTFCRERKIACGRPPTGSPDPTCNQCARRSLRCRYLDSKSTPIVRSRTTNKDPSSLLKRK